MILTSGLAYIYSIILSTLRFGECILSDGLQPADPEVIKISFQAALYVKRPFQKRFEIH
jgi:hypothetical protein